MRTEMVRHEKELVPGIVMGITLPVWEKPVMKNEISDVLDTLLHGQMLRIREIGPDESYMENMPYNAMRYGRMLHFVTDYGYEGYITDLGEKVQSLEYMDEFQTVGDLGYDDAERMENLWATYKNIADAYAGYYEEALEEGYGNVYNLKCGLKTVWAACADLVSVPDITNTTCDRITVYRGAKLLAAEDQSEVKKGWTKVYIMKTPFFGESFFDEEDEDDYAFYIRSSALEAPFELVDIEYDEETKLDDCSVYGHVTPLDEEKFRQNVVDTAKMYLGTQYRWAGKTPQGIDCSGLCSMAYMLNGVYIYRDASIEEQYPVKEIVSAKEWAEDPMKAISKLKPADLIYFKGHIAMYLGDCKYIHSTAKAGSDGVVINSFRSTDDCFRQDLYDGVTACGSIFW
ncbi:MAG: C40 family peptidase [Eubacteriales bacterium]|nr:C40 family peptidase [Eubacteriales bacterium]